MSSKTKKSTSTTTSSSSIMTTSAPQQRSSSAKKSVTPTAQKTTASTSSQQQHTSSTTTTSTSANISKSQISPTRYSRQHEKEELANLNDRLACYIERVRNLETENSRLTREIKTSQETVSREVNTVKTMYDRELSDARKLIDELSREKAKLEIDARHLYDDNEELKANFEKKSKECSLLQTNLALKESHLTDMTTKYNASQQDRKKLQDENKNLEEERNKLAALVPELRTNLEGETLSRVELENTLQGIREELAFKEQVYQQELMECRTRRQEQEISEIDGRLIEEYEERLCQSLQEIRDQYEIDLENNREEIKKLYEEKLRSLASQLSRNSNAASMALDEMKQMQQRMEDMNRRLSDAEADKNFANQRARDLEKQLERLKSQYMEEFAKHDMETTRLREEMALQVQEYQGLMDIKVALDLEIAAYRKLIEGEEARLKIPPVPSPTGRGTPQRAGPRPAKRRRMFREESEETMASNYSVNSKAKGDIELSEIDLDGKFVRVLNKGSKEVSVSGWQLVRKAGEAGTTSFKFHRSVKIEPGSIITVWSADVADQPHEPPENIVMKGQKWFVADSMTTSLLNSSGEEVAVTEHTKQQSTSSISRQRGDFGIGGGQFGVGSYFQRTPSERVRYSQSPGRNVGEERCRIM